MLGGKDFPSSSCRMAKPLVFRPSRQNSCSICYPFLYNVFYTRKKSIMIKKITNVTSGNSSSRNA